MSACVEMGLSPRQLEGWTPTMITKYTRDDQGRIVSAITTQDAAWDNIDRLFLEAHQKNENNRCKCGGYLDETTKDDHGYHVGFVQCYRCEAKLRWEEEREKVDEILEKSPNKPYPGARILTVEAIPLPPEE